MSRKMDRRGFLKTAGITGAAVPLAMVTPGLLGAATPGQMGRWDRILVMVELKGGNDGLNTVIPYHDNNYYQLRPRLAFGRDETLKLDEKLGLNPNLEPLMDIWGKKDLAVILGVGYPDPNRSHFRSIEIWETGSDSHEFLGEGWVARMFSGHRPPANLVADGVVIGQDAIGPLTGRSMRTITMREPKSFIRQARKVETPHAVRSTPALDHILKVHANVQSAADRLERKLDQSVKLKTVFPGNPLGGQLRTAARLIASRTPLAVIKVSINGFDTHSNQVNAHNRLMSELGTSLAAFRNAMVEAGMWDQVLVMTYSEFGRRVRENGSRGTDHGTAAPHFMMGGRVKGGFYGNQPSLDRLDNNDLIYTCDYRQLYATVTRRWWELKADTGGHNPLDVIG